MHSVGSLFVGDALAVTQFLPWHNLSLTEGCLAGANLASFEARSHPLLPCGEPEPVAGRAAGSLVGPREDTPFLGAPRGRLGG